MLARVPFFHVVVNRTVSKVFDASLQLIGFFLVSDEQQGTLRSVHDVLPGLVEVIVRHDDGFLVESGHAGHEDRVRNIVRIDG